jgi:hypothetical protein
MSKKISNLDLEANLHTGNFNQIVGLAEKLMNSLVKRVHQAEDSLK